MTRGDAALDAQKRFHKGRQVVAALEHGSVNRFIAVLVVGLGNVPRKEHHTPLFADPVLEFMHGEVHDVAMPAVRQEGRRCLRKGDKAVSTHTHAEIISRDSEAILAPAFVEFVKWVLKSAGEQNIRRIYFLARDGYPMYRAAQILSRGREPEIECRYLRCSRYALRIPSFHLIGKEAAEQICLGGIDVTLRKY